MEHEEFRRVLGLLHEASEGPWPQKTNMRLALYEFRSRLSEEQFDEALDLIESLSENSNCQLFS